MQIDLRGEARFSRGFDIGGGSLGKTCSGFAPSWGSSPCLPATPSEICLFFLDVWRGEPCASTLRRGATGLSLSSDGRGREGSADRRRSSRLGLRVTPFDQGDRPVRGRIEWDRSEKSARLRNWPDSGGTAEISRPARREHRLGARRAEDFKVARLDQLVGLGLHPARCIFRRGHTPV